MAFTSIPTATITNNIQDNGLLTGCAGILGEFTFTASSLYGAVVGQYVYEFGEGDNSELGTAAKITNIVFNDPGYTITVDAPNKKTFVDVNIVTITERGIISEVKIKMPGDGYSTLPYVIIPPPPENDDNIPSNDRKRAKIVAYGSNIGRIKDVYIVHQGFDQEEIPLLNAPVSAIVYDVTRSFTVGRLVYDANYDYDTPLMSEAMILANGPNARVKYYDAARNYLELEDVSNSYELTMEDGLILTIENGYILTNEYEHDFSYGTLIKEFGSDASARFLYVDRAILNTQVSSALNRIASFNDNSGFSSEPFIKLHDGNRIQDYSYFVKAIPKIINNISTSLNFIEYRDVLRKLVHPAGYLMFGENQIESYAAALSKLYIKYLPDGSEDTYGTILTIILQLISINQELNYSQLADNDFRANKYKQIMLILESYILVYKEHDADDLSKRLYTILLEQYVYLGGLLNYPGLMHIYLEKYTYTFVGFNPKSLDRIKFNMTEETVTLFDTVKFTDFDDNIFEDKALRKIVPLQAVTLLP